MLVVSSFYASSLLEGRDVQNSATELLLCSSVAAVAPSQHQRRRSSQQHYNLALKWTSHLRVPPRGAAAAPRPSSSSSFVVAAATPSKQQQQATAVSRNGERSTGAFFLKVFQPLEA